MPAHLNMSSHHMQSHSDPNYLIRLQNLRLGGNESPSRRTHSLNGSVSAIETLAKEGNGYGHHMHGPPPPLPATNDYKLNYDRTSILSAAKLASNNAHHNAKMSQNFVAPQTTMAKGYLSGTMSGYIVNNSPTHSLSGSSQHSGSPRTSLNAAIGGNSHLVYDPKLGAMTVPVYENIDYYGTGPGAAAAAAAAMAAAQGTMLTGAAVPGAQHPHHHAPIYGSIPQYTSSNSRGSSFDSSYKKAESQVPNNAAARFAHTPQPPDVIEATPIYENVLSVTGKLHARNSKSHQIFKVAIVQSS